VSTVNCLLRKNVFDSQIAADNFKVNGTNNLIHFTGTGKTVTIVESIVQILRYDGTKKILVCAPSDAACDVIAKRLLPVLPRSSEILRINWVSRNPASLPPVLLGCSPMDMSGFFMLPSPKRIQEVSVVICQCFVAGCLELELSQGPWIDKHFTHCFIDESSQR
jgi:hypothetical protein